MGAFALILTAALVFVGQEARAEEETLHFVGPTERFSVPVTSLRRIERSRASVGVCVAHSDRQAFAQFTRRHVGQKVSTWFRDGLVHDAKMTSPLSAGCFTLWTDGSLELANLLLAREGLEPFADGWPEPLKLPFGFD